MKTIAILMIMIGAAFAESERKPAPDLLNPIVPEPPPHSTYSILIAYASTSQSASNGERPVKIEVWRDAGSRKIVVTHANGVQSEGYLFDSGFVVRSTADPNKTFVSPGTSGMSASFDYFTKEFQGSQWVDRKWYQGVMDSEEGRFHAFLKEPDPLPVLENENQEMPTGFQPINHMPLEASLRLEDQTPAFIRLGDTTYTFTPIKNWQGTIEMPESFRESADSFVREAGILERFKEKRR